jgi:SET domain-containing protein
LKNNNLSDYNGNELCVVGDSPIHGRGLFARHDISTGTWIGHYDGPVTTENGMHVLWVEAGEDETATSVDGWIGYDGNNELRFLNHAKKPNAEMDGRDLHAARNISAGEEITIDYGEEFEASG